MILGIDSSLGTAVAVIDDDGVVLSERSRSDPLGHAEVIGVLIEEALADAEEGALGGTGPRGGVRITRVAVGMGPGPFTGLRVGIAAGRAFALGRGIPVSAVASHEAIALGRLLQDPFAEPDRFAVVTDARRKEFAVTLYEGLDDDGLPTRLRGPELVARDDVHALLQRERAVQYDATSVPASMVALVAAREQGAGRVALSDTEPLYLRAPDVTLRAATPPAPKEVAP